MTPCWYKSHYQQIMNSLKQCLSKNYPCEIVLCYHSIIVSGVSLAINENKIHNSLFKSHFWFFFPYLVPNILFISSLFYFGKKYTIVREIMTLFILLIRYQKIRLVFSRFLDLCGNLGNVIEKPTRKTCFSREKKRLTQRIYLAKFC